MATFTVTSSGAPGSTGFTFEEAVQQSILSAGPDTIRFAPELTNVQLNAAVTISGELVIDGDHNGDGISDVVIGAGQNRHLNIDAASIVTIRNVDFIGGSDSPRTWANPSQPRPPAEAGANGGDLSAPETPETMDGADAEDGGHGSAGTEGVDGVDAVGSILNRGTLVLERVGFSGNLAVGEVGERGGTGGSGARSIGEDGQTDYLGTANDPSGTVHPLRDEWEEGLLPGGAGGDGGRGGNGGNGGDGGDAAGAILNEGSLTLIDTVFAGRLTSGLVLGFGNPFNNQAQGGD